MNWDNKRTDAKVAPAEMGARTQQAVAFDEGLRQHMLRVYNVMGVGLVITGLVAMFVANFAPVRDLVFGTPLFWVAAFAPLAFLWFGFTPSRVARFSAAKLQTMFYGFAAIFGVSLASVFLVFSGESIARVFFITATMFLATSLFGYTTKRDLSGMSGFLIMGMIGVFIASLVNIFLGSPMLQFVYSVIGVIVFTGMTAWDTQRIKETYAYAHGTESNYKVAVMGALGLFLNFVLLFQFLLNLMGQRD